MAAEAQISTKIVIYLHKIKIRQRNALLVTKSYTTCSENVCIPKALYVEREILRKKSLLPFLQIMLIYDVNGHNTLNKPTNQRRGRRARRRSGWSHSATAEGEGETLRRLEGSPPAPIDLSITRTLSLFCRDCDLISLSLTERVAGAAMLRSARSGLRAAVVARVYERADVCPLYTSVPLLST